MRETGRKTPHKEVTSGVQRKKDTERAKITPNFSLDRGVAFQGIGGNRERGGGQVWKGKGWETECGWGGEGWMGLRCKLNGRFPMVGNARFEDLTLNLVPSLGSCSVTPTPASSCQSFHAVGPCLIPLCTLFKPEWLRSCKALIISPTSLGRDVLYSSHFTDKETEPHPPPIL